LSEPDNSKLRSVHPPAQEDEGLPSSDGGEGKHRRRGVYLLPNIITTAALFAGFYATVAGMNGRFVAASLAIFAAIFLDTADGRIARLTRTESNFGAEYDSLSDMVAFGVAPAFVAFSWGLSNLGQIGWVVTFVYVACTALRLARFNTKSELASFTGLASPSAAAVIACTVWVWHESIGGAPPTVFAASMLGVITTIVALLMVSNFTYFSPKQLNLKGRVPFVTLVLVVLAFAVLLVDPPRVLLAMAAMYALSGPLQYSWQWLKKRNQAEA
jgi:CDP-diacylglycerol--serine O-phosphatidyltransferase